jgi:hypothetical protein
MNLFTQIVILSACPVVEDFLTTISEILSFIRNQNQDIKTRAITRNFTVCFL